MKPKILIFGHWNESDSLLDCPYQFDCAGYAHIQLPILTKENASKYSKEYDLILIAPFGADTEWCANKALEAFDGDGKKIVLWSFDSHNAGWAEHESKVAGKIRQWYTAHSQFIPVIGNNAKWLPCCCTWIPVIDCKANHLISGRWIDFSGVMRKYPIRAKIMDSFSVYLVRMGKSFFLGEGDKLALFFLYQISKCVLNINLNQDLNIRSFEALVSNANLLTTPSHDFQNPLFDDLRDSVFFVSPNAEYEEFESIANKALNHKTPDTETIIRSKHMLFHRYVQIAKECL